MLVNKNAEYTARELRDAIERGDKVHPVFGLTSEEVRYEPRSKYDPSPWAGQMFRYHTWELTVGGD